MDETQRLELLKGNARKILAELMNLPPVPDLQSTAPAEEFVQKYGPLHPYIEPVVGTLGCAERFRLVWQAKSPAEIEDAEEFLEGIFGAGFDKGGSISGSRPLFRLNLSEGRWTPVERTLLDILAVEMACSRKMIARCENPECQRFFARLYPNDKYCGTPCGEKMRSLKQRQWALDHQEELKKRRRKTNKAKARRTA